jgi:putative ABC transport system permease protein
MQHREPRAPLPAILHDVFSGIRIIRQSPFFSLLIILTAALGIGANTAVFSVVNAVLLQPPPYPHGERLAEVWEATSGQRMPVSWINFQHWRHESHAFEEMAGFETADLTLTGRGDAVVTRAGVVSSSFFHLMGWRPLLGRLFDEADDAPGARPAVLVSSEFFARMLNNDPHVLGTALVLDGTSYQIIGILPPGLRFFTQHVDVYMPAGARDGNAVSRADHGSMVVLGLLKTGIRRTAAEADLDAIMRRLAVSDSGPENDHRSSVLWLADFGSDDIRMTLLTLSGAAGLVLFIACANLSGLLLLRSTTRKREIAIRSALGATRSRLAQQLLTENFILMALGGGAGLLLAGVLLRYLLLAGPQDIPRLWETRLNLPVLSFTAAVTVFASLLAGLAPVFDTCGLDIPVALKDGSPGAGSGRRGQSLRNGLMIAEIALTLVLTFGSGLLLRSLTLAQTSFPGFSAEHVLAVELQLPPLRYRTKNAARRFYERLMQDLRREPGVESVGAVNCPPSTGGCAKGWYSIADMPAPTRAAVPLTLLTRVDAGYFGTLRIPLLAGRRLNDSDRDDRSVVVVNETFARRWWPERHNSLWDTGSSSAAPIWKALPSRSWVWWAM